MFHQGLERLNADSSKNEMNTISFFLLLILNIKWIFPETLRVYFLYYANGIYPFSQHSQR